MGGERAASDRHHLEITKRKNSYEIESIRVAVQQLASVDQVDIYNLASARESTMLRITCLVQMPRVPRDFASRRHRRKCWREVRA